MIVKDLQGVTDTDVISKAFQTISSIHGHGGTIDKFKEYLKEQNDQLTIISNAHFTRLDYIVKLDGNKILLTEKPENLVFLEK